MLWTLFPQGREGEGKGGRGGVQDPNFFGHDKFEVTNLSLNLVLWTISTGGGGRGGSGTQLFLGHAKFEVKKFSLHLALWTLFPQVGGGGLGPNFFFCHAKFEVKNFSLHLVLWTISAGGEGGKGRRRGGVWDPTFFGHAKFEVKNFFGGEGSSSFSTHAFHIHTPAIQIRIVAFCISKSTTKNTGFISWLLNEFLNSVDFTS